MGDETTTHSSIDERRGLRFLLLLFAFCQFLRQFLTSSSGETGTYDALEGEGGKRQTAGWRRGHEQGDHF